MKEETAYFVLKKQAVPDVLLKVLEAKKLLDTGKALRQDLTVASVGTEGEIFLAEQISFADSGCFLPE